MAGPDRQNRSATLKSLQSLFSKAWTPPLFLALLVLLLFEKFLLPGNSFIVSKGTEDLASQSLWWRQFGFDELRHGHLALWNPHIFCGTPFFGGFQPALLYPPNWLCLFLPLPLAINLGVTLHVFLMGWFTYLWVRGRGSRVASALLAGLILMFGAAYFLRIVPGHLPNLCAMPWIPLILFAVDRWGRERKTFWILLGMAAVAMQVFAGHIQITYYTAFFVGAYVLGTMPQDRRSSFFVGIGFMGLGAGLLCAVQLLAGWDAGHESMRGGGIPLGMANIASMTPERLWCLLVPDFFGGYSDYWGGSFYWEGVIYGSITAFLLSLFALKASKDPQKKFLGWTALFLLVLSLGTRTPLFAFFYHYLPLFNSFRGIGKLDILITLCLAALAAKGLDEILENPASLKSFFKVLVGVGGFLTATTLVFATAIVLHARVFGPSAPHAGSMTLNLALSTALVGLLIFLAHQGRQKQLYRYGLLLVAGLELFLFAARNLPSFDYRTAQAKADAIQQVYLKDPGNYRVTAGNANYTLGTIGMDVWGDDPVLPSRYARFVELTQKADARYDFLQKFSFRIFPPSLGLLRLRYVFTEKGDGWSVQRLNLKEASRASLVGRWEVLKMEDINSKVIDLSFDPTRTVLLETDPGLISAVGSGKNEAVIKDLSSDAMEVQATLVKPAILVLTDNYSRGWKTKPSSYQVLPANGFQIAIPLGVGEHHFKLEYRPTAFVVGKWISLAALLLYLSACAGAFLRKVTSNPRRGKIRI